MLKEQQRQMQLKRDVSLISEPIINSIKNLSSHITELTTPTLHHEDFGELSALAKTNLEKLVRTGQDRTGLGIARCNDCQALLDWKTNAYLEICSGPIQ